MNRYYLRVRGRPVARASCHQTTLNNHMVQHLAGFARVNVPWLHRTPSPLLNGRRVLCRSEACYSQLVMSDKPSRLLTVCMNGH